MNETHLAIAAFGAGIIIGCVFTGLLFHGFAPLHVW